jgi:hypothetical protein
MKVMSNSKTKIETLKLVLDDEDVTLFLDLEVVLREFRV